MRADPSKEEIKKDEEFLGDKRNVLNFLDGNLDDDWTLFYRPHLNGLSPDLIILNPQKGIQVINFYSGSGLMSKWQNLLIVKDEIPKLFSPRMKTSLGKNAYAPIALSIASEKLTTEEILEEMDSLDIRKGDHKDKLEKYYPIISRDVIESDAIDLAVPVEKYYKSKLMKQTFVDDLLRWLVYPDEKREKYRSIELDTRQAELASTRTKSGYRRIKGSAGSGKSQVLASRAVTLAQEGKKVLILSFNITLFHYLRSLTERVKQTNRKAVLDNITYSYYHGFIEAYIWETLPPNIKMQAPYYTYYMSKGLFTVAEEDRRDYRNDFDENDEIDFAVVDARANFAIEHSNELNKYDAVLIDEGQDWDIHKWSLARKLVKGDGELVIVADRSQDIYGKSSWTDQAMENAGFDKGGRWAELGVTHRLPSGYVEHIRNFGNSFMKKSLIDLPEPKQQEEMEFESIHLEWKQIPDHECTNNTCVDVISSRLPLLLKEFNPSDITFLAISNENGKSVVNILESKKNIRVQHTFGHLPHKGVLKPQDEYHERRDLKMEFFINTDKMKATTIESFKGWESPALVVQIESKKDKNGNPLPPNDEYMAKIYTALTRLRSGENLASYIYVVCSDPIFDDYQKTWNK
jgi:hypothetical protein